MAWPWVVVPSPLFLTCLHLPPVLRCSCAPGALLRGSVLQFSTNVEGTQPKDVMKLLMVTQYFDVRRSRSVLCCAVPVCLG